MADPKGFLKVKRKYTEYRPVCERIKDYGPVFTLRSVEHSQEQASRCMDCGTPFCHWGCPIGNYIPEWNDAVFKGDWRKAFELLDATNNMPEITGRLCPALCEYSCVLGINDDPVTIRENELGIIEKAFEKGYILAQPPKKRSGKKVAVVGSGPAGLSSAAQLNRAGHQVVVFERDERVGGILRYGIPDFKLEKRLIERRVKLWQKEGIQFKTKINVGITDIGAQPNNLSLRGVKRRSNPGEIASLPSVARNDTPSIAERLRIDYPVSKLLKEFDALCLACGSRVPRDLKIEGRNLSGIHFAMDYLIQSNKKVSGEKIPLNELIDAKGKRVLVIGGGDTGADCVGTAHRQGASCVVQIEVMPKPAQCRTEEMPWPKYPMILKTSTSHEEGGQRQWAVLTKKFSGEGGQVKKVSCVRVEFPGKDSPGCPLMKEAAGSEFEIEADLVLLAIGFIGPEHQGLVKDLNLKLDSRGAIQTDDNYMSSKKGVFSAGDMRRGQSLIVWAISEGRRCARAIDIYLTGKSSLPAL